jgi:hypothetical protein
MAAVDNLGDAHLCTQEEWRARGEAYGNDAAAVLVIDGSVLFGSANYGEPVEPYRELRQLIESLGYYIEMGFAWTLNFYPAEDDDEASASSGAGSLSGRSVQDL